MDKIIKKYEFKNFLQAIEFVNKVATVSEKLNHHPDIKIHNYNKVTIHLYTHSENGLTEKDYELEKQIENLRRLIS